MYNEVCGEAGDVWEETVADCFARHQAPLINGTCLQCSPLWFSHRQVLPYKLASYARLLTLSIIFNSSFIA
jgi:hypothetical protein